VTLRSRSNRKFRIARGTGSQFEARRRWTLTRSVLVSTNMLDLGFEYAVLRNLMMARCTLSTILYKHTRGRVARAARRGPAPQAAP